MQERQEAMFEELKIWQRLIYSGVMTMYDHYKALDQKVDQLLGLSDEKPPRQPRKTTETKLVEDETCIQKTITSWQDAGEPSTLEIRPQTKHANPPRADIPSTSIGPHPTDP